MLVGFRTLYCYECGHKFKVPIGGVVLKIPSLSLPEKCPNCGSYHTSPGLTPINRLYHKAKWKIADSLDKSKTKD